MSAITIVIPCYNAASTIERCLNALARQSYKDFKVILVDDASTDSTVNCVEQFKVHCPFEIEVIRNGNNSGPAVSRNVGILCADTEYIAFCDADDWYDDDFLNVMKTSIEQHDAEIAFCGYKVVDQNGRIEHRAAVNYETCLETRSALRVEVDSLCMMLVKTSIMKQSLLPDLRNGEDMAVIPVLISRANKCVISDKCLYNYYRNNGSSSQKPTLVVLESLQQSFEYIKRNLSLLYKEEIEYLGIRNYLYASIMTLFSITFDVERARQIVKWFEGDFPNWISNQYISVLPFYKKIVVILLGRKCYKVLWGIARVRKIITGM